MLFAISMKITERSVQEIGKSLLVTLPKEWVRALHVKKGTKLKILTSERGALTIMPELVKENAHKDIVIPFDEHFNRRFFREYFEGYERIIVTFSSKDDRSELYSFLKRFMNTQIIEDSPQRIVVKSFRIEELSMEECMNRMHFLSISILAMQGSAGELRDTMTRFYYMLVMQVRRFLSEGKFTDTNQIPLLKAMDIRMVAEKIQRIAEIAMQIDHRVGQETVQYYSRSFWCFANNDFAKALPLWKEGNLLQKRIERQLLDAKKKKNIAAYAAAESEIRIIRYAKEISMLVR
jgi:phosphate uptake regulator